MAAARGGGRGGARGGARVRGDRGGASGGDAFTASLRDGLAAALDVEADRLDVRVTLDGEPVRDREVVDLDLRTVEVAPVVPSDEDEHAEEVVAEDVAPARAPAGRDRSRPPSDDGDGDAPRTVTPEELDEEAEAAADLLEGLLDAMDLPGDLRIHVQEAHAEVEIVGVGEGVLIGRRGQTLEAVQDLVRTAMQRRFERRSRVLVDVDGYRARRMEKLYERADEAIQEVLDTGEPQRLEPMDSIERRLIHQRVASHEGVVSRSHGREPARRIEIVLDEDD